MSRADDPKEPMLLKGARFNVHQMTLIGDDGRLYQREVIRHPGAVVLLPILNDGRVVLIENTRPTVGETLLELPAGTREADEEALVTAGRELIEETGYRAGKLELVHQFYSAPGICDELMHLYQATELVAGDPEREATESIVNRIATRDEIRTWIADGTIRDAKTLVGLYAWLSGGTTKG
ncbi:ADP-ribose pyrophosphatase [Stieleria maiorica]|uniref:GDP-mannose pyrophosphatase n=1 Tax=Stieleria maiorica TaxID=2795974 RepID=A0A5B9MLS0_9BACT|nr:NUDIX hydrolase [Stieleria maiorica]QEG00927.1 ADP-ribose pyrophosphatase [Stieleria maiorica]